MNGAQLIYVSTKSEALINKCRTALNSLAFNISMPKIPPIMEYTKPVIIPFGCDSFKQIEFDSIEAVRRQYSTIFEQSSKNFVIPNDPAKDINFAERDIDLIRAHKDKVRYDNKLSLICFIKFLGIRRV